jgi:phage tail-like protein
MKKIPGRMKWNNITLKRGITGNMDMWKWREKVEKGKVTEARLNGSVTMHDQDGTAIARWNFINAWPSKLTGPTANATNNEVGVEELEITHETYERVQ